MAMTPETRSYERQRVGKGHLPRLAAEFYRGRAFVHWTLTMENRATGWLTPNLHHAWQIVLLHACARYGLACPVYVLMPDHVHMMLVGLTERDSDQRVAIEFIRKHLLPALAPAKWQQQPHDHVLRDNEREQGAFQAVAQYIFENPARAGLVEQWQAYSFLGCCVAGYPEFDVRATDCWQRFWRCYNYLVDQPR